MARIPIGLEAAQSLQPSNSAALLAGWLAVAKDARLLEAPPTIGRRKQTTMQCNCTPSWC